MKKQVIILLVAAAAAAASAQQTNDFNKRRGDNRGPDRKNGERPEWSPEQHDEREQRKIQLMGKVLSDIGVSDEDKIRIAKLQDAHRSKMKENMELTFIARDKLSKLQDNGATEAELDAAIDAVVEAQAQQLKILVRNRMEMEEILGKEKYAKFMEKARMQFRQHEGRRGDGGLPPRPGLPPMPKDHGETQTPALPSN